MQEITKHKPENHNLFINKENVWLKYAFLVSENKILIALKKSVDLKENLDLFNHKKEKIQDLKIIKTDQKLLKILGHFPVNHNYFIKFKQDQLKVILDPAINGILDTFFFHKDIELGTILSNDKITFRFWSPPAVNVKLLFFKKNEKLPSTEIDLKRSKKHAGLWELIMLSNDLIYNEEEPVCFQYQVSAYGKNFIALDPYSKSMAVFEKDSEDKTGKAAIVDMNSLKAKPSNFKRIYRNFKYTANEIDIIAYEINVRDYTIQPGVTDRNISGTFKGFIKKIEYLKELGITHVQLMPVNKAYTQIETERDYSGKFDKPGNYNWGYDPLNFFTLEGRYSTDPHDPFKRIYEFREMIQALHNAGIGVILDVVFNHTYTADVFENAAPGCYYRYNDDLRISNKTGAGPTIESRRKQVRKFIKDVLKFYVSEYHIDGFRFDLMSFTDKETMREIRNEVGTLYNPENKNELILQGEAWIFTDLKENAYLKTDFESLNIGIFNDTFRDSLAGNGHSKGFIQGNMNESGKLASAIIGAIKSFDQDNLPFNKNDFFSNYNLFAEKPSDCLNYFSIHDGLTLWDKINISVKDASKNERLKLMKLSAVLLFTSQGKIILHGGDEILRTKPKAEFDKESHRTITSEFIDIEEGTSYFHENSYSSNDYTNKFRWNRLTDEYSTMANELYRYYCGLIKMRRSIPAFRFSKIKSITEGFEFYTSESKVRTFKINSFKSYKIKELSLKFINGTPGSSYFLAGEVHSNSDNPKHNPYRITFNEKGTAEIKFTKEQIMDFDLKKWNNDRNLNIKLVYHPDSWEFPTEYYSTYGNNALSPESINENFEIIIDLSVKDFKTQSEVHKYTEQYLAYIIDNKTEKEVSNNNNPEFNKLFIIHNPQKHQITVKLPDTQTDNYFIIVDGNKAGTNKIENSNVIISDGFVKIPSQSSAVLATY